MSGRLDRAAPDGPRGLVAAGVGAVLTGAGAAAAAVVTGSPGWEAVAGGGVVAGCTAVAAVAIALVPCGPTAPPPRPWAAPERTSAGWHDVRLLADAMDRSGRDPVARRAVAARARAALDLPPTDAPVTRADLAALLARLTPARRSP